MQHSSYETRQGKLDIIEAYAQMLVGHMREGWQLFFLTVTYNQLVGNQLAILRQMLDEAERTYATILNYTMRNSGKKPLDKLPLWVGCPDWPTPTSGTQKMRQLVPNDGMHQHIIACHPRLKHGETLEEHLSDKQKNYSGFDKPIFQLDCRRITETPERVTDYVMKSYKRHRLAADEILVLPRHRDELTPRDERVRRPVRLGETIITPDFENKRLVKQVERMKKRGR